MEREMNRYRIVLFLFGVIAVLAVLCAVLPEEGVLGLRFPQLCEIFTAAEPVDDIVILVRSYSPVSEFLIGTAAAGGCDCGGG